MFREIKRYKQALTKEECIDILKQEPRGILSVLGDNGYPYGMPLNHWYNEMDGTLYFHSGKTGHKIDAMKACSKVSFCVYDQGFRKKGAWSLNIKSVIVFGRIKMIEDHEEALEICRKLSYKFTPDSAYIEHEIQRSGPGVLVFQLIPEHITGKLVNEA